MGDVAVERLRRADGLELLGEYSDSGFRERTYLVRRGDGQMVRLSRLLYLVLEGADGRRKPAELAGRVSDELGRRLTPADLAFLIERKLRPAGLLHAPHEDPTRLRRSRPVLALNARLGVVPRPVVETIGRSLRPLFRPAPVALALCLLVGLDAWLFIQHGVSRELYAVAREPGALLLVVALTALGTVLHELGHAGACSYGGARPGRVGVGLYLVWPVLYTDLTDTYRLGRRGRLRADLGGVYFNLLFVLALGLAYGVTGLDVLVVEMLVQHYQVAFQLLPLLRLDGHYVLSDLTGVPDILSRVRPVLRGLLPGRPTEARADELRPGVRRVVVLYAGATVLLLSAGLILLLVRLPGMVSAAVGRLPSELARIGHGPILDALAGAVGAATLALPVLGSAVLLGMLAARLRWYCRHHGLAARSFLWPQPGLTASSLAWNALFVVAEVAPLAALVLAVRGAVGSGP